MDSDESFRRFQMLRSYVAWCDEDLARIPTLSRILRPTFRALVEDFYELLQAQPDARAVLSGGSEQIARLKVSLHVWLTQLFNGEYDQDYVIARLRVGRRHVEIGVTQVFVHASLARMRNLMIMTLRRELDAEELTIHTLTLNKLLDLDLAIIEYAYESEYVRRQKLAERLRLEGVLHREREFSEGLIEHAQAIVLILDIEGRIVRFNPYMEELSGYRLEDVKGHDWFSTFLPHDETETIRAIFAGTLHGRHTSGTMNAIQTRSGQRRLISWSNKTLRDQDGKSVAVLAVGQDITELEESQQRALQAERLAAIGKMSTGLAHESSNALQRIQASAELLELEVEDNPVAMEQIHQIQNAQHHLHRLLDEVRGYAGPVRLDIAATLLSSAWREAWGYLMPQRSGRRIELVEDTGNLDLRLPVDHFRLVQVFRILLENSLAACQDPVKITIRCENVFQESLALLKVSVQDNGPGLGAEQRNKIFEPFFTTKSRGTGLGLAIAQRNVEAHGGTLELGPGRHGGAEFVLLLPRTRHGADSGESDTTHA